MRSGRERAAASRYSPCRQEPSERGSKTINRLETALANTIVGNAGVVSSTRLLSFSKMLA